MTLCQLKSLARPPCPRLNQVTARRALRVQRRGLMYGHEGVREIVAQTLLPAEEGAQKLIASRSHAK